MSLIEIILLCIALSMDCFAICIVYGAQRSAFRRSLKVGETDPFRSIKAETLRMALIFIVFHLLMIVLGWFLGYGFLLYIDIFDHWIAFGLLAGIGIKMIWESFTSNKLRMEVRSLYDWKSFILLGFATSIDAFAVGVGLSLAQGSLLNTCYILPFVLLFFTFFGVSLGFKIKKISVRFVNLMGGLILLGIGVRILLEHEYGIFVL